MSKEDFELTPRLVIRDTDVRDVCKTIKILEPILTNILGKIYFERIISNTEEASNE